MWYHPCPSSLICRFWLLIVCLARPNPLTPNPLMWGDPPPLDVLFTSPSGEGIFPHQNYSVGVHCGAEDKLSPRERKTEGYWGVLGVGG